MIHRYIIWILALIPPVLGVLYLSLLYFDVLAGVRPSAESTVAYFGLFLSYYGFLFSLFAALEIKALSNKYYFRIRSPEINKKLLLIARKMNEFSREPISEIRSQPFISEIPVILRSAKRVKNKEVIKVAKNAERSFKKMTSGFNSNYLSTMNAGQADGYWDVHQIVSELADEIRTQIDDVRAAQ
ncbi:hypothetical protein WA1_51750 [Scytonema hofmannii PCC 7110]|uniref:Uncharacterized protein n=1 Tax=Scytonema hofmannii PCC 7110 TaxID=128403 RepID=A0A139WPV0_9CYAN|nr:hypothetical protein [Scytonema hofmannii]KYC34458.1 hypothetical protein WA1_51750 [Scytonema hofmannii PCC 7110]